jgi:hypothetical protein
VKRKKTSKDNIKEENAKLQSDTESKNKAKRKADTDTEVVTKKIKQEDEISTTKPSALSENEYIVLLSIIHLYKYQEEEDPEAEDFCVDYFDVSKNTTDEIDDENDLKSAIESLEKKGLIESEGIVLKATELAHKRYKYISSKENEGEAMLQEL